MSKPVILCVDDDATVLSSLNTQIKHFFGSEFRIEMAENGREALVIVKNLVNNGIDLPVVVSDQIMPGMKGDALLSDIYKVSNKTLNIMLTGQADIKAVGNAVNNAKLFRYIKKPWNGNDLNQTVKEAIRSYFLNKNNEAQKQKVKKLVTQLEEHNDVLEERVNERTKEIEKQKNELENTLKELKKAQSLLIHSEKMAPIGVLASDVAHET
ncbi:MAG: response regulator [Cytophagales bacterium]|nr:response regulator [Cytophagales bacterium]